MARPFRHPICPDYKAAILATPGLVGYWRLGEASGTVARDEMGANNGTYVGSPTLGAPGLLAGDADTAMTGVGGLTDAKMTSPSLPAMAAWTVAVHVKANAPQNDYDPYLSFGAGLFIVRFINRNIKFHDGAWTTVTTVDLSATSFAFTYNAAVGFAAYKNGDLVYGPDPARGAAMGSAAMTVLGTAISGTNTNDTIDELPIWNRALTAAEIAGLYRVGMGR